MVQVDCGSRGAAKRAVRRRDGQSTRAAAGHNQGVFSTARQRQMRRIGARARAVRQMSGAQSARARGRARPRSAALERRARPRASKEEANPDLLSERSSNMLTCIRRATVTEQRLRGTHGKMRSTDLGKTLAPYTAASNRGSRNTP